MTDFVTCDLCDEHKNDTDGAFRVLPPVFKDFGKKRKFAGPVSTVKCFEDNSFVKAAVDSPGNGRVLVVDGGASLRRALVGGNLGKAAAKNGWAGVLVAACVTWPSWPNATPASGRWPPCPCPPRSATRASATWPCRSRACGCARAIGSTPTKTASW